MKNGLLKDDVGFEITSEMKDMFSDDVSSFFHDLIIQCRAESREHLWYVREYTGLLAGAYAKLYSRSRLSVRKQELIVKASVIHDLGKITIPDFILEKPGQLSATEMEVLKKHTIKGGQIIKSMSWKIDRDFSRICYNICLYHHEKYDGSGYPYGIKGNKIPIEAQLVGLADIYDALLHGDINREQMERRRAYYLLMNDKCGMLSPRMKECFDYARDKIEDLDYKLSDEKNC